MTLEEIGNIGEVVGAIGVVISLIYLALQVRDNSRFVKENTVFLRATNEISSNEIVAGARKNYFDPHTFLNSKRAATKALN